MKRIAVLAACLALALSVGLMANTPTRVAVFPQGGDSAFQIATRHNLTVLEDYGGFVWAEASKGSRFAPGDSPAAFYTDWDVIKTAHSFSIFERQGLGEIAQTGLYLVHFQGPVKPEWMRALGATPGVTVVQPYPNFGLLIHAVVGEQPVPASWSGVDWVGALDPSDRIDPRSDEVRAAGYADYYIELAVTPRLSSDLDALTRIIEVKSAPAAVTETLVRVLATAASLDQLQSAAQVPSVVWIEALTERELLDEVQDQIVAGNHTGGPGPTGPGYAAWLTSVGLTDISGVIVDVADDGWDTGNLTVGQHNNEFDDAAGTTCRMVALFVPGTCSVNHGLGGHGNINQSIVMGRGVHANDPNGYAYGMGIAPTARGTSTRIFGDSGSWCAPDPSDTTITWPAYQAGARITSNSWGWTYSAGQYNTDSQFYDRIVRDADLNTGNGLQPYTVVFAAGNDGSGVGSVTAPGTGKNVITSGASENYRMTGTDGCAVGNTGADNLNDVIDFSGRGPCDDGRRKPDAMAPGTHIQGAASQYSGYNGSSVCDQYWPTGQTWYCWSSGTSHSTPAMSGAAALITRWFQIGPLTPSVAELGFTPSPAMIKAAMMATSDDMYGGNNGAGGTNTHYPDNIQGWGRVNLGRLTDTASKYAYDQAHTFTASGQSFAPVPIFTVVDPTRPLRIMLVWSDAPGTPTTGGLVNNLDLQVTAGGSTYLGNVFSNGYSTTGGTADTVNNVEAVYLPAGAAATFTVNILATNIAGAGIPGAGNSQDFALFIYNATSQTSAGIIALNKPVYTCTETVGITVSDSDLQDPNPSATITVTIGSTTEPGPLTVTLTQTGANTGVYTGTIALTTAPPTAGPPLSVAHGDTITATYHDANHGGPPADVTATATTDCQGPVITNVLATVSGTSVDITWNTSEPADSFAAVDTVTPPTALTASNASLVVSHLLHFQGLVPCTQYYFYVRSADAYGNSTTANNGGAYYTFTTGVNVNPTYTKVESPPLNIPDNTTVYSDLAIPDDKIIQKVVVTIIQLNHTFDGDLDIYLQHPDGTLVELTTDNGSSGDNYINTVFDDAAATSITTGTAPFTGTYRPEGSLATLNGKSALGTWRLRIADDAGGDTGTLTSWSLNLLFPAQGCGPEAEYVSSTIQDVCATGGPGNGNGYIDPGETITLPVTIHNSGTVGLTGVTGTLSTTNPNVTITQATTTFGSVAYDANATSIAPHVAFTVAETGLACGDTIDFTFTINSNEGGPWTDTFSLTVGQVIPGGTVYLINENFSGITPPALPAGWTTQVVNGTAWITTNSYSCSASNSLAYRYSTSLPADSWAFTPGQSLQPGVTYTLAFNQRIASATWPENGSVWLGTAASAAGMTTLLWGQDGLTNTTCTARGATFTVPSAGTYYLGFHCTSAANMFYLVIDDVALSYTTAPECNIYPCSSGPAFDMNFRDQYNRAEICLSSTTGDYIYNVLTGAHAGDSFTGVATITRYGTAMVLFASPCTGGVSHCVSGNWNTLRHTAAATLKAFTPARYSQALSDANYLDSPPCATP